MTVKPRNTEPFFHEGGSIGCLLIHGFTGSPAEMAFLGGRLAEAGFTVSGIRLPGHGTTVEDMACTSWDDWSGAARQGVQNLRRTCDKVVAIGLSMGGLITLDLACDGWVDAMVALNAPMVLSDRKAKYAVLVAPFIKFFPKPSSKAKHKGSDSSFIAEGFWYDKVPLNCLASLNRAIKSVRAKLHRIDCPVLLMQSTHDKTVDPQSLEIIINNLKVTPQVRRWEKSGHILTLGPEREAVAEEISRFIKKESGHV